MSCHFFISTTGMDSPLYWWAVLRIVFDVIPFNILQNYVFRKIWNAPIYAFLQNKRFCMQGIYRHKLYFI